MLKGGQGRTAKSLRVDAAIIVIVVCAAVACLIGGWMIGVSKWM